MARYGSKAQAYDQAAIAQDLQAQDLGQVQVQEVDAFHLASELLPAQASLRTQ
jgi:hypothetical protein